MRLSHAGIGCGLLSCSYSVFSLQSVVDTDGVIRLVAENIGTETSMFNGKTVLSGNFGEAARCLSSFRNVLIQYKAGYDAKRKALKAAKKRFPVQECFTRDQVLRLLQGLRH